MKNHEKCRIITVSRNCDTTHHFFTMSAQSDVPKQLSSRLKDMKFMKRKEESNLRTKLEQERARDEESMRWTVTSAAGASVVVDDEDDAPSMVRVPGRRSFGGFNQNVEKIVSDSKLTVEQLAARAAAEQDSINDEEMASR
jgi:M-phase phosphoprotein-6